MNEHAADVKLTRNQQLVYDALTGADTPLSAYSLLDQLRESGFRAPLQVYRALEKLIELGQVHRLESINSFVACQHSDCQPVLLATESSLKFVCLLLKLNRQVDRLFQSFSRREN